MSSAPALVGPPGHAGAPLVEIDRWEWRQGQGDLRAGLASFLSAHGLDAPFAHAAAARPATGGGDTPGVGVLLGAFACNLLAGWEGGPASPAPAVPDAVLIAYRPSPRPGPPATPAVPVSTGEWRTTWTDGEHAAAVQRVRAAIARGELYQASVVGHRQAAHQERPIDLARAVAGLPGASYAGVMSGPGWAVGSASPEQLVKVVGGRITTVPVKGTRVVGPGAREQLQASLKDRAEHIMIVDLERNDLARVARTGTVVVEQLYEVAQWAQLWHAGSLVAAELREDVGPLEVLAALAPGGSVTGAPKRAACELLADLEPVGRGPSMGAFGMIWPGGMDLGLSIRTVAVDEDSVHLWAGGGITWGSDPELEVIEAHDKARPLLGRLGAGSGAAL